MPCGEVSLLHVIGFVQQYVYRSIGLASMFLLLQRLSHKHTLVCSYNYSHSYVH